MRMMNLTVRKLADIAGVSVRTLHFYDETGLLKPESRSAAGYRFYGEDAVIRLQQILLFRELDFSIDEIKKILAQPDYNMLEAMHEHKRLLTMKKERIGNIINTLDKTINSMNRKKKMQIKDYYHGFSEEKIEKYREEVRRRWGKKTLEESEAKIINMGTDRFIKLQAEGGNIFKFIYNHMAEGYDSPVIQEQINIWRQWLENFHHYSEEEVLGLGRAYSDNPEFAMFFKQYHDDLPVFLTNAIEYYHMHRKPRK